VCGDVTQVTQTKIHFAVALTVKLCAELINHLAVRYGGIAICILNTGLLEIIHSNSKHYIFQSIVHTNMIDT
jgi:hypothetical protein